MPEKLKDGEFYWIQIPGGRVTIGEYTKDSPAGFFLEGFLVPGDENVIPREKVLILRRIQKPRKSKETYDG